jgi:hypothetical protein
MRPETGSVIKKMIEIVKKEKEQARIFRDMKDTIAIALKAMRYEMIEEEQLKTVLKEIAEMMTRVFCDVIKHPDTTLNEILNTPTIKIRQTIKTRTLLCSRVSLSGITQLNILFTIETYEIQTPTKQYIIVTDVKEVKPGW